MRPPTAPDRPSRPTRPGAVAPRLALRAALLVLLWWVVTEGHMASLWVGVPAALAAALLSLWLAPEPFPAIRPLGLVRFLPFFLLQSVRGGLDVLRRAYDPALPLAPAIQSYPVAAMGGSERVLFAIVVSLLPGTLSARLDGDLLRIHVLDERMPIPQQLAALEARLAPVFGRGRGERGDR